MLRPSVLIMGATLSTNYPSGPIVSRDWCDKEALYHVETSGHLQAKSNRRQEQYDGHDPGVVGGSDGSQPRLAQACRNLPTVVLDRRSNRPSKRPLLRGELSKPTARRTHSPLASLLHCRRR